jgi:hypothetical protein
MGRKAPRKRLTCRVISAFTRVFDALRHVQRVPRTHPNVSRRSAHPSTGVSEAKGQSPDAAMRARERDGLFDIVSWFSRDVLILRSAHAERVPQTRTRVRASRRVRTNHCVRPHASRRIAAHRVCGCTCVALRCPQHEGEAGGAFWQNEPAARFGQTDPTAILAKRSRARVRVLVASEEPTCRCTK